MNLEIELGETENVEIADMFAYLTPFPIREGAFLLV